MKFIDLIITYQQVNTATQNVALYRSSAVKELSDSRRRDGKGPLAKLSELYKLSPDPFHRSL